jgi:isochorismate hydrolase
MMARWWRDMIDSNSHGAAINDNIHIPENSYKTEKHQYSAFFDTELYDILNKEKAESIIITGVMTHLCCDATAREGFMHGFAPVMVADACASYNEELHAASLIALSHGFAQITDSKTIIQQINAQKI